MTRLKNGLVKQHREQLEKEREQERLKKEHHIHADKNTIVVEKKSALKYLVLAIGKIIQISATIVILGLAIIGVMSLSYPTSRNELFLIIRNSF